RQELVIALPPERLRVEADPVRLAQVLANLLHNAAKFTPEGGRIWLTAEKASGGCQPPEAVMRVRDTGIGIPADMLPRVFDLFTQVDRPLDHSEGGLGIGLTLVRSLVELHGGTVEPFSPPVSPAPPGGKAEGRNPGSEFVIRLPLLPDLPG